MSACCPPKETPESPKGGCGSSKKKFDYILWPSLIIIALAYVGHFIHLSFLSEKLIQFSHDATELMNKMWWGLFFAIIFVGLLNKVPRSIVMATLGTKKGINGILRATAAGLLLDLCNHGILVVGMKFYERGASLGQTMAFLIASPWNSFSLTLILVSLIGLMNTLLFILLSCVIAIVTGLVFESLVQRKILPDNPNSIDLPEKVHVLSELKKLIKDSSWSPKSIIKTFLEGLKDSKMILRWIFFGVVLAAGLRGVLTVEDFQTYFGPSIMGLGFTLLAATIIEVCSEGSAPIAGDLLTLGNAPGNSFTFLMAGASTDYTEIMAIKETTKSWKIALFLPLVTVPQIVALGYILNQWSLSL
jgi:uncharacterized membrane protein YraQ (UPF0718 family)